MMKKSYLMKIYNLIQFLGAFFFLSIIFRLIIEFILINLINLGERFPLPIQLFQLIEQILKILYITNYLIPSLIFVLILQEVFLRLFNDSLINLGKSIIGTFRFRKFLKHHQKSPKNDSDNYILPKNEVILKFNKAIKKSVIDLTNKQLKLLIKIPKEAQSQKILKEHEEQIKEHISSLYPDYIISTFERNKFNLWLIGTKSK
ncbi:hypothetical protein SAMN04487786_3300 [Paenisporosarcina quisquiliarum]|nr:hypothetical protein SAMN04487786_3300 [Paenisporosarcina quisquiliarum]